MRASVIIVAGLAGLAMASPIVKKAVVTNFVTEVIYVYVTAGAAPAAAPTQVPGHVTHSSVSNPPHNGNHKGNPLQFSAYSSAMAYRPKHTPGMANGMNPSRSSSLGKSVHAGPSPSFVIPSVKEPVPSATAQTESSSVEEPLPSYTTRVIMSSSSTDISSKVHASVQTSSVAPVAAPTTASVVAAVAPSTMTSNALPSPTDYKSTVLYHHNIHRFNHSANALVYDDTLASYAYTVASSCVWGHDLTPGGGGYGQNIADAGTTDPNESKKDPNTQVAAVITDMWYNAELPLFLPSYYGEVNPDFSDFEGWGHMTQVVWKATTKVGCATYYCAAGTPIFSAPFSGFFTVCNYADAGNMGGEYGVNVGEPLGHDTIIV